MPGPATDTFDVVVVGGGIVGAAAAWALARGGATRPPARALLLESRRPGHDRGSSHGDGRIVRFTYPEPVYVAMAHRAYPLWRELEQRTGQSLLLQTGSWECGSASSPRLAEVERSLELAGLACRRFTAAESRRRFPQFELPLGSVALYQPEGAVVRAGAAVAATWKAAAAAGADLRQDEAVVEILPGRKPGALAVVRTAAAEYRAGAVVLAAGGWNGGLLAGLGLPLPLQPSREVLAYFAAPAGSASGFIDHRAGAMPAVIDYHSDPPFYALPQIEVPGVKAGWHHSGPDTDPDQPGEPDPAVLRRLQSWVADRMPFLDLRPIEVLTCLYTNTPDYHFVLDRPAALGNVVIGAGFSGHGFKFGPVLGEILADLATGQPPGYDLDLFSASRFQSGAPLAKRSSA